MGFWPILLRVSLVEFFFNIDIKVTLNNFIPRGTVFYANATCFDTFYYWLIKLILIWHFSYQIIHLNGKLWNVDQIIVDQSREEHSFSLYPAIYSQMYEHKLFLEIQDASFLFSCFVFVSFLCFRSLRAKHKNIKMEN